jgi:hypothetical protein
MEAIDDPSAISLRSRCAPDRELIGAGTEPFGGSDADWLASEASTIAFSLWSPGALRS